MPAPRRPRGPLEAAAPVRTPELATDGRRGPGRSSPGRAAESAARVGRFGCGRRRAAEAGDTTLTSREQEIGDLVARGLTNREIAERLYLSPRTVEVHLSRIFTKLDVSNRSALAHALAKAG